MGCETLHVETQIQTELPTSHGWLYKGHNYLVVLWCLERWWCISEARECLLRVEVGIHMECTQWGGVALDGWRHVTYEIIIYSGLLYFWLNWLYSQSPQMLTKFMRPWEAVAPLRTSRIIALTRGGGSHGVRLVNWSGLMMDKQHVIYESIKYNGLVYLGPIATKWRILRHGCDSWGWWKMHKRISKAKNCALNDHNSIRGA